MAELSIAGQIGEARKAGYSDDEIAAYLSSSHPQLAPQIKEAVSQGYSPREVLTHLSLATIPDYGKAQESPDPGFIKTAWDAVTSAPKNLMDFATGHPRTQMDKHFADQTRASGEAFRRGDYPGAVSSGLAAFLPGAGDEATAAGEEYGAGHPGAGTAHAAMALAPFLLKGGTAVASRSRSPVTIGPPRMPSMASVIKSQELEGVHPGATWGTAWTAARQASRLRLRSPIKPKALPQPPSGPSVVDVTSHNPVVGEGPLVNVQNPPVPAPYNPVVGEGPTVPIKPQPVVQPYNPVVGEGPIVQVESPPPRGQTTTGTGTVGKGMPPAPELPQPPAEAPKGTPLDKNNPEHVEATIEAKRLEIQQRKAEIAAAEKAAADKDKFRRTDLNRAAHAIGSELDLPESPAGTKLSMNTVSQGVHGKNWGELSTDQMNGVVEFMMTHRRPPTRADILSGTYKP